MSSKKWGGVRPGDRKREQWGIVTGKDDFLHMCSFSALKNIPSRGGDSGVKGRQLAGFSFPVVVLLNSVLIVSKS